MPATGSSRRIGHEFLGVVEDTGPDVSGLKAGDVVLAPFMWADNTCDFCREGLHTSCRHGGGWAANGIDGGGRLLRHGDSLSSCVVAGERADDDN